MATNNGFTNSTLPVDNYLMRLFSINLPENTIQIKGLENNQKFKLGLYYLNGILVKKCMRNLP
ncbi:hypothetical protein [uncultured Lutibacter sp.]|uniref:hypothetical protein n=1 Tax=uncultured Lutibacter sp. TaxID=437739 RepID=UPI00261667F4|nr:hypothetical protein [uncultured Lutibacter sp.]